MPVTIDDVYDKLVDLFPVDDRLLTQPMTIGFATTENTIGRLLGAEFGALLVDRAQSAYERLDILVGPQPAGDSALLKAAGVAYYSNLRDPNAYGFPAGGDWDDDYSTWTEFMTRIRTDTPVYPFDNYLYNGFDTYMGGSGSSNTYISANAVLGKPLSFSSELAAAFYDVLLHMKGIVDGVDNAEIEALIDDVEIGFIDLREDIDALETAVNALSVNGLLAQLGIPQGTTLRGEIELATGVTAPGGLISIGAFGGDCTLALDGVQYNLLAELYAKSRGGEKYTFREAFDGCLYLDSTEDVRHGFVTEVSVRLRRDLEPDYS